MKWASTDQHDLKLDRKKRNKIVREMQKCIHPSILHLEDLKAH